MRTPLYPNSSDLTKGGAAASVDPLLCADQGVSGISAKAALRRSLRTQRAAVPGDSLRAHSLAAQQHILADPIWKAARIVALYMPLADEVDTALLVHMARLERRQVWLPRCLDRAGTMEFALYTGPQTLREGMGKIMEPDPDLCPAVPDDLGPDLVIVPGLAFDAEGYRLGYGGGYYDRLLSLPGWVATRRLGLGLSTLCVERLPRDAWDIPVHALATEEGLRWI